MRIASEWDSGIEWVTLIYSISKGPRVKRLPGLHLGDRNHVGAGLARRLGMKQTGREGAGIDRHAQARPEIEQRAEMVLVGMGDDDAFEVLALFLEEGDVREDDVDARQVLMREGDAEIDGDPALSVSGTVAVEREVHADLADPAEGHEDEFVRAIPGCHQRCAAVAATPKWTSPALTVWRPPSDVLITSRPSLSMVSNTPENTPSPVSTATRSPRPAA